MSTDICTQLRERGEHVAAEFIERLGKRFVDEERKCLILERSYSQQQKVWDKAIARADRYEEALREMLEIVATHRVYVGNSPAGELACEWTMDAIKEIYGKMEEVMARAALGEKKDGNV